MAGIIGAANVAIGPASTLPDPAQDTWSSSTTRRNPAAHDTTVLDGDTLSEIADYYQVPLRDLIAANPQIDDAALIHPGEVVHIPAVKDYVPALEPQRSPTQKPENFSPPVYRSDLRQPVQRPAQPPFPINPVTAKVLGMHNLGVASTGQKLITMPAAIQGLNGLSNMTAGLGAVNNAVAACRSEDWIKCVGLPLPAGLNVARGVAQIVDGLGLGKGFSAGLEKPFAGAWPPVAVVTGGIGTVDLLSNIYKLASLPENASALKSFTAGRRLLADAMGDMRIFASFSGKVIGLTAEAAQVASIVGLVIAAIDLYDYLTTESAADRAVWVTAMKEAGKLPPDMEDPWADGGSGVLYRLTDALTAGLANVAAFAGHDGAGEYVAARETYANAEEQVRPLQWAEGAYAIEQKTGHRFSTAERQRLLDAASVLQDPEGKTVQAVLQLDKLEAGTEKPFLRTKPDLERFKAIALALHEEEVEEGRPYTDVEIADPAVGWMPSLVTRVFGTYTTEEAPVVAALLAQVRASTPNGAVEMSAAGAPARP